MTSITSSRGAFALLSLVTLHAACGDAAPGGRGPTARREARRSEKLRLWFAGRCSQDVTALAQTPDGYLWIGTQSGLSRFDGVRFDTSIGTRLPSPAIHALFVDPAGDLWIGYLFGGVSRLHAGELTPFPRISWCPVV